MKKNQSRVYTLTSKELVETVRKSFPKILKEAGLFEKAVKVGLMNEDGSLPVGNLNPNALGNKNPAADGRDLLGGGPHNVEADGYDEKLMKHIDMVAACQVRENALKKVRKELEEREVKVAATKKKLQEDLKRLVNEAARK